MTYTDDIVRYQRKTLTLSRGEGVAILPTLWEIHFFAPKIGSPKPRFFATFNNYLFPEDFSSIPTLDKNMAVELIVV